jgi:glycosyltransferase involved in cell wall biosynthesis
MDKFYYSIDLLILPSQLPDPLPTVVLEAMQYGVPVAATEQGGALEMIAENETGIFIPINNVQVAVDKIFELIQSNNYNNLHAHSIKRVQTYFSMKSFENQIGKIIYS